MIAQENKQSQNPCYLEEAASSLSVEEKTEQYGRYTAFPPAFLRHIIYDCLVYDLTFRQAMIRYGGAVFGASIATTLAVQAVGIIFVTFLLIKQFLWTISLIIYSFCLGNTPRTSKFPIKLR